MPLFFPILVLLLPDYSQATDFIRPCEIRLRTEQKYYLAVNGTDQELALTKIQYGLVSHLKKSRSQYGLTQSEVMGLLEKWNAVNISVEDLVDSINSESVRVYGRPLMSAADGRISFFVSQPEQAGTLFALDASGRGAYYRGHLVPFTPKQLQLIRLLAQSPTGSITYGPLRRALRWTERSAGPNARRFVEEINLRTLEVTGARLLEIVPRHGLRLNPVESSPPTFSGVFALNGRRLTLEPIATIVCRELTLNGRPLPENLSVTAEQLVGMGLPLNQVIDALFEIYGRVRDAGAEVFLSSITVQIGDYVKFVPYDNDNPENLPWRPRRLSRPRRGGKGAGWDLL